HRSCSKLLTFFAFTEKPCNLPATWRNYGTSSIWSMVNLYHERKCKSFFTEIKVTALQFVSPKRVREVRNRAQKLKRKLASIESSGWWWRKSSALATRPSCPVRRGRRLEAVGQRQIGLGIANGIARLAAEPQGTVADDGARKGGVGAIDIARGMLPGIG